MWGATALVMRGAPDVDVRRRLPVRKIGVEQSTKVAPVIGVVDQDVDPSGAKVDGVAGECPNRLCISKLGGDEIGLSACSMDLVDDGITASHVPAAHYDV